MILTLAAFADFHLSARPGGRFKEACSAFHGIVDDAAAHSAACFAIVGDLYHAASIPSERLALRGLLRHASNVAPVVVVGGNHDAEHDLAILDAFGGTHPVHVAEHPRAIEAAGMAFGCIPHLRRGALARQILSSSGALTTEALRNSARAEIVRVGHDLRALPSEWPRVGLAHAMIVGAKMSNDQPTQGRGELDLASEDFEPLGADVFVFGHIHRGQSWSIGGRPAAYPGSPYATTYGEIDPKKYLLIHFDGREVSIEPRETNAPRLILLVGTHGPGGLALSYGPEHESAGRAVSPAACKGADVRLRYATNPRDQAAIDASAADARRELLEAGAIECKLEAVPDRVSRARAPGFRRTKTLHERLDAYWIASGRPPARRENILVLLDEIATSSPEEQGGLVRFERFACCGLGPFTGEVSLSVADLPPVTALLGENGAGKSTFLGLLLAALREESPTHGVLDRLVTGERAYLEVMVATVAATWTIRHDLPSKTVTIHSGEGLVESFGRAAFREWARAHLPDPAGLLLYAFLPPRRLGVAELYDGDLKTALLGLLGARNYETWAGLARKRASSLELFLGTKRGELKALPTDTPALAEGEQAGAATALDTAKATLHELRTRSATRATWEAARAAKTDADAKHTAAKMALGEAQRDQEEATTILAAVARTGELNAAKHASEALLRAAEREAAILESALRDAQRAIDGAEQALAASRSHLETLRAAERKALRAVQLAAELPALEAAFRDAKAVLDEAQHDRTQNRLRSLRDALTRVGAIAASASLKASIGTASRALREIARLSKDTTTADGAVPVVDVGVAAECQASARLALERARDEIAAAPALNATQRDALRAETMIAAHEGTLAGSKWRAAELGLDVAANEARREALNVETRGVQAAIAQLAPLVQRAPQAASSEAARVALEAAFVVAEKDASAAEERLVGLGDEPDVVLQSAVDQAERTATAAASRLALARDRLDRATSAAERAAALGEEIQQLERAHADASTLAAALGKDGIQAIAVELAGEAIAEDATARLHAALGPTWTIEFRGTRQDARGKRVIEQARWMAKNHADGREREIRACSEGEKALLGTALALALVGTMIERWGAVERATLAFDETAAALRGDKVEAWFGIVQRAVEDYQVGNVLVIPPDGPALAEMADTRVRVSSVEIVEEATQ